MTAIIQVRCLACPEPERVTVPDDLSDSEAARIAYLRHVQARHVCMCGHGDGSHDIGKDETRGACSVSLGTRRGELVVCGCSGFVAKGAAA